MTKTNQRGFAALSAILIVAVILAVVAVGYVVYQRQSNDEVNTLSTPEDVSQTEEQLTKDQENLEKDLQKDTAELDKTTQEVQ